MRVIKVLNNSLVLVLDKNGRELILMGKGIGYNKSTGYHMKESEIEKVFILKDRDISKNIIRLAAEIDNRYFELAEKVISYAVDQFQMELMEHIYLGLTDHLSFAVKRMESGIEVQNFYTSNLKKFNPNEFSVGLYACRLMKEELHIELPVDEAGNIAFHFINAQQNNPYSIQNRKINEAVKGILDVVKYNFAITYDEDGIAYTRFVTHLRTFAQRLVNSEQIREDSEDLLFDRIISVCEREYQCVKKIGIFIKETFYMQISRQEELYLTIHIHRILEEYTAVQP